jgi:hypothetical protein
VPLGEFEGEVLRLLARNRNPDSHVAGATVLNQAASSPRTSRDIDIFHDSKEAIDAAFADDQATLKANGYTATVSMDEETFKRAQVSKGGRETKLEWVRDSSFRFYPAEADDELGYRLNYWDAATNKVLAAVFRNVIRDYIDLLEIHQTRLSLGALIWAAAGKDDGLSPLFMIEELVRIHRYPAIAYDEVTLTRPFDRKEAKQVWLQALHGNSWVGTVVLNRPRTTGDSRPYPLTLYYQTRHIIMSSW